MDKKIIISKSELLAKLKTVSKVIKPSNIIYEFSSIMFEINENKLKLTGADEEGNIITELDCVTNDIVNLKFLVDAKTIIDGLKELNEQPIELAISKAGDGFHIVIKHNNGCYELQGVDSERFPIAKNEDEVKITVTIDALKLSSGIKKVIGFASNDTLRPVMCSVFVESKYNYLSIVAINHHTMAFIESKEVNEDFRLVLPVKIAKIIHEISAEVENITLQIGTRNVTAEIGQTTIIYRLVEGNYPNYKSVIPPNDKILTGSTSEIKASIKRAMVFSNKSSLLVKLSVKTNCLNTAGRDIDFQQSSNDTLTVSYENDPIEIGFKGSLLLDCLDAIDTEEVNFYLSDPAKACLIRPVRAQNTINQTLLIMPLLINS